MNIKKIKTLLIVLFLLSIFDWGYGFYQLLRFVGMIGFIILAYDIYENKRQSQNWLIFWAASAILINPFIKIALGRELWVLLDYVWAIILIIDLIKSKKK